nr:MAG TPA: hypothetical protein [Bacteriophage sp.]
MPRRWKWRRRSPTTSTCRYRCGCFPPAPTAMVMR